VRTLDPRLLRYARATRTFLFLSVALGSLRALLIVGQAWLLVDVIVGAFSHGKDLAQLQTPLTLLLCAVLARGAVAWAAELAAGACSAQAKSQLRGALLARVSQLGLDSSRTQSTGELTVLATRGLDALDGYFSLYLPQVLLAAIVPVVVLVAVVSQDWVSAAIVAFTIPLIPLFMALVGAATREKMDLQMRTLQRLAGHFLDVVAGLPTLKVFGRAKAQAASIHSISERYRESALSNLRVTFLSSLILELLATISVALVAVAIGLRLMGGEMSLRAGLFALVLAPEAYMPLRQLGANYHASAEGVAAAEQVFAVLGDAETAPVEFGAAESAGGALLENGVHENTGKFGNRVFETPATARGTIPPTHTGPAADASLLENGVHENAGISGHGAFETPATPRGPIQDVPDMTAADIAVDALTVAYPDRARPALDDLSLRVEAGEVVALAGTSGCGKSTLLGVLLGFVMPTQGEIRVGGANLAELDDDAWRSQLAWVPQRPHLFATSIAENVRLGRRDTSDEELAAAVAAAGLDEVLARLPAGLDTRLGERGAGLSAGERQRVALARAFLRDAPLLLLDEPTANLDGETERQVLDAVRRLSRGRTVILVAHRPALLSMADRVVDLASTTAGRAAADRPVGLDAIEGQGMGAGTVSERTTGAPSDAKGTAGVPA
jgi:ATP-binding cassette subfamily C protein CydCD